MSDDRSTALERIATARTNVASPRALQGEAKRQKTFNPMENVELNVATCPVCNNSVFEGQVHCTTCGQLSPLNPRLLKEQQRNYIMQRSNLLKKMGLSTHVTAQVLARGGSQQHHSWLELPGQRRNSGGAEKAQVRPEERLPLSP